jgi:TatD DNase family protein
MLIDAHVHIDKYGDNLEAALSEIAQREIFTIAVAMDAPSYAASRLIARRSPLILPTFGIHPRRAPLYATRLRELGALIEESPAIGEIGLDFHWEKDPASFASQRRVLEYFFAAAREQNKLVNLHTKGGENEILHLLEKYQIRRAIVHWYSGPLDILSELVSWGAHFTVGVEVLFSEHIKTIAREIPDRLLLTETDNPGGLAWLGGGTGMPRELGRVIEALAQLRNTDTAAVAAAVQRNFLRLIENDPWLADVRSLLSPPTC